MTKSWRDDDGELNEDEGEEAIKQTRHGRKSITERKRKWSSKKGNEREDKEQKEDEQELGKDKIKHDTQKEGRTEKNKVE